MSTPTLHTIYNITQRRSQEFWNGEGGRAKKKLATFLLPDKRKKIKMKIITLILSI